MPDVGGLFNSVVGLVSRGQSTFLLAAVFTSGLVAEIAICGVRGQKWTRGEAGANLLSGLIGLAVNAGVGVIFAAVYIGVYAHLRLFAAPSTAPGWVYAYGLFELVHYVEHRMSHRMGFFWALHSVHHSSAEMNLPVANRIVWGIALFLPFTMIGLPLMGVSPTQFGVIALLTTLWGIFTHTRVVPRLGWLEHVFVTPANHRVHHGRQLKYLDCNYSQCIILFDKLFGSHQLEEEEPEYGLIQQRLDRNPFAFQIAGFRELGRKMGGAAWRDKLRYLYKPPGWSHTGEDTTTESLRAAAARAPARQSEDRQDQDRSGTTRQNTAPVE